MQVLYRKYRPRSFEEVTGQDHVVRTLKGALLSGRIGHAYLFSGPRGVGKTTMARLLAKALNCVDYGKVKDQIPCDKCFSCNEVTEGRSLDIIEIDGASNRGIDEIRSLKESAQVAASGGKYKVFIIDEVHMLTPPAFSALLKILEEPPSHVIFILATTDVHKIPQTILSRVQRFEYKKITPLQIAEKLKRIAKFENINLADGVALTIAHNSEGALRDAESALTKLISFSSPVVSGNKSSQISVDDVRSILGIVPEDMHTSMLEMLINSNGPACLELAGQLYDSGISIDTFLKQFIVYLRSALLLKVNPQFSKELDIFDPGSSSRLEHILQRITGAKLVKIIQIFTTAKQETKTAPLPQLPLELAILEIVSQTNG